MKSFAEDETVRKKFVDAALSRSILPAAANECEGETVSDVLTYKLTFSSS